MPTTSLPPPPAAAAAAADVDILLGATCHHQILMHSLERQQHRRQRMPFPDRAHNSTGR